MKASDLVKTLEAKEDFLKELLNPSTSSIESFTIDAFRCVRFPRVKGKIIEHWKVYKEAAKHPMTDDDGKALMFCDAISLVDFLLDANQPPITPDPAEFGYR
jgi:hypothetical protein